MTPDDRIPFARNLDAELNRRKGQITARAVAAEVGLEEGDFSRIRHGKREPSVTLAARIARALGVSLDALARTPADAPVVDSGALDVLVERRQHPRVAGGQAGS